MIHPARNAVPRRIVSTVVLVSFAAVAGALALTAPPQIAAQTASAPARAAAPQALNWKPYSYPADGFRISFPSAPEVEKNTVPTDVGKIELRSYTTMVSSTALYAGFSDFGTRIEGTDPDALLQGGKKGALSTSKSRLVSEKKINLGKNPGLEFEGEGDSFHLSARIYLVADVLYQTTVVSPINDRYADTARFLDSFQLIPRVDSEGKPLAAPASAWKPYNYPADGFSASYPSEPEMQKRDVPTHAGSVESRSYIAQAGPVTLFVDVCDFGNQTAGKDPDELLQGAKNGALTNSKSHLTREKKITLGTYHGVELESESDESHFYARVYMVGTTLYQTLVVWPLASPYPDTIRFLDSFHLVPRAAI